MVQFELDSTKKKKIINATDKESLGLTPADKTSQSALKSDLRRKD